MSTTKQGDGSSSGLGRPEYDKYVSMNAVRGPLAANYAKQILLTTGPFLPCPPHQLDVLDIGCGYGQTAVELAKQCKSVVGIEPSSELADIARQYATANSPGNCTIHCQGIYDCQDTECYDLVVLDNVLEHLPDQPAAIATISRVLRSGGVAYILVPNKLWPIEVHYHLPFLSYLPIKMANVYLRVTGCGTDYTDASYAPTYWGLNRLLDQCKDIDFQFVTPADVSLATNGQSWLYYYGVEAIKAYPFLWAISKAFLVVGKKR